jgi:hypothetical protein
MHHERGERLMETWTKIDRAGAAYLVLNVVFWWGPLVFLAPLSWFWAVVLLGLVRDACLAAAWLGYRTVRLQRSFT